jgi:AAA family ATP:ADP antiporter
VKRTSALLMMLTMFLVLGGYYLLKTAREVFILSEGGADVKSYSSAGQALLLLVIVPAYGAFASRVNRVQLVQWVTLFFASHIVLFLLALSAGLRIGVAFFLWLGIFNVMVIAQFWALAADLYTEEQGKRLFPLIGVGSSLGAWIGSVRAGQLVQLGASRLLVSGAIIIGLCALLSRVVVRTCPPRPTPRLRSGQAPRPRSGQADDTAAGGD